jgi:hypothetical protein
LAFGLLPPPPTAAEAAAEAASSDGASVKASGRALGSSNRMSSQTWRSAAKSPFDVPESKSSKSLRAAFATWSQKQVLAWVQRLAGVRLSGGGRRGRLRCALWLQRRLTASAACAFASSGALAVAARRRLAASL